MTRILIDMQGLQTESSRFRGIGRYTDALAQALIKIAGQDIHLLVNQQFKNAAKAIEEKYEPLIGLTNIHYYSVLAETDEDSKDISELIRELAIDLARPDVVFCPSFFESSDHAGVSIGRLSDIPVVTTLHDLIPLVQKELYLETNKTFQKWYMRKLEQLKTSSGFLVISEFSKDEAIEYLKLTPDQMCNTYEGAFGDFRRLEVIDREDLAAKFGIEKDYIFYTGGVDPRKNLTRLFEAYSYLDASLKERYHLVLAGKVAPDEKAKLVADAETFGIDPEQIHFLGFVSDEDLVLLYNAAMLFVFPSLHEGFGLPAVEAMQCGIPVIGANKSSLPEVIGNPDALFDPYDAQDLSRKLAAVLSDPAFRQQLIDFSDEHVKQFSWENSAKLALDWFETIHRKAGIERPSLENWSDLKSYFDQRESHFVHLFARSEMQSRWSDDRLKQLSDVLVQNRRMAEAHFRADLGLEALAGWRIEGPFDSSYSLSIVNQNLARGLAQNGVSVGLHSSEGPGDFDPDPQFLKEHTDLNGFYEHAKSVAPEQVSVTSRNMYPPRADAMPSFLNGFHNFAWEETGFPIEHVVRFNQNLDFLTVTSEHVRDVMINNGVNVPIFTVGNGIDHWQTIEAGQQPEATTDAMSAGFVMLHVSSCFPRKGPDSLLEAYGKAFSKSDDVLLVIKSFDNPHNDIREQIAALQEKNPDYPAVHLILDDLSDSDLKALYERADLMVLPSRAEGFGLPIAEAILSGLPVITTGWSGGLDIARAGAVRLVDFDFAHANSHLGAQESLWAEPKVDHLATLMRQAFEGREDFVSAAEIQAAQDALLAQFRWDAVGKRNIEAAKASIAAALKENPRVGWISTFNKKCGIATYTDHLLANVEQEVVCLADYGVEQPEHMAGPVVECWRQGNSDTLDELFAEIQRQALEVVVIQFNYGFFNFGHFGRFLRRLKEQGCTVVVFMHSTQDKLVDFGRRLATIADSLAQCDRLLVHTLADMNNLKQAGIHHKAALFPHGILRHSVHSGTPRRHGVFLKEITLSSYGFFLPQKGLAELIDALKLLRDMGVDCRLRMVNARYPADVSTNLIDEAREKIEALGLSDHVEMHTDFLPDEDSIALLQDSDIIVYPYQPSGESASGAVRYGIASDRPVAVTPVSIFEDIKDITYRLPGVGPKAIAMGLKDLIDAMKGNHPDLQEMADRRRHWQEQHAYPALSYRLEQMLRSLYKNGWSEPDGQ